MVTHGNAVENRQTAKFEQQGTVHKEKTERKREKMTILKQKSDAALS